MTSGSTTGGRLAGSTGAGVVEDGADGVEPGVALAVVVVVMAVESVAAVVVVVVVVVVAVDDVVSFSLLRRSLMMASPLMMEHRMTRTDSEMRTPYDFRGFLFHSFITASNAAWERLLDLNIEKITSCL